MNFRQILTPMDGSENSTRALKAATYLAEKCNGNIFAVYVLPFPAVQAYRPDQAAREQMFAEAKNFLEDSRKSVEQKGIPLQHTILEGNPGSAIVAFAQNAKNKIDLIVIGSRGLSGLKEAFLGSVSSYVVHKSKLPVLVVK